MRYRGDRLLEAIEQRHRANQHVAEVLHQLWPRGSSVAWIHEGRLCHGKVERTLYGEQLAVVDEAGRVHSIRGSAIAAAAGFN